MKPNIIVDNQGRFGYNGELFIIDVEKRDDEHFIQLYMAGTRFRDISESELESSGVVINTLEDFIDVLRITLEDNWGYSKFNIVIPAELGCILYNKWRS